MSELVDADGFLKLERIGRHILVCVYPQLIEVLYDPTNPDSGKLYIRHFFAEFERRLGGATDSIFSLAMNWILESRGALFGANTCSQNLKKQGLRYWQFRGFAFCRLPRFVCEDKTRL